MPDTGAPYFIPFADPTNLVRDWPALSEDVAEQVALGLDAAGNAGIGSNVVQTVKTNTFSTTSTSPTNVTGLSVTITPTSASSKVLLLATLQVGAGNGNIAQSVFVRFTGGNSATFVGDASGSRNRAVHFGTSGNEDFIPWRMGVPVNPTFLDAPNTTDPVTYQMQIWVNTSIGYVGRSAFDTNSTQMARTPSSLIAIEVAA